MQKFSKINELESLRGLAAILVIFYHVPKYNDILNFGLFNNGNLMVEVFFVLSGYVIYKSYANKIKSKNDLLKFQFLRLARLYPVHIFFLSVFIIIELAKYYFHHVYGIISPNSTPFLENNLKAIFQHLLLIQAIGPTGNLHTFNGPAWSISVEFYTYLIFAFIILYFYKYRILLFSVIIFSSLIMLYYQKTFGFSNLLGCQLGFFIGCLISKIEEKIYIKLPAIITSISFFILIVFVHLYSNEQYYLFIYFLTAILIYSINATNFGVIKHILNQKIFIFFGKISYSLYMSHLAILWVINQFVRFVLKKPEFIDEKGISVPQLTKVETLIICSTIFFLIIVVSNIIYNTIENPIRKKSRKLISNN